ncbi:hypothetical protein BJ875DRAFT_517407 [Amylocarpus encephaloides]|uniref:Uncharacterized protein n=1 Tax=Amylocarpus encephaloides TaxID=45428 RepID=A0A9P7YCV8_9HELO|nr:hypothetical protein BJ875DRAFT_517407 [Amylocarpus encephaloides]
MDSKERRKHTSISPDGVLSQRTSSVPISFFSLPGDIRNNIYRRVLVVGHPLFLFQDTGSTVVETFAPDRPFRWLALLYTNRQVHDEASAVLYGLNHFTFMDTTRHQGGLLQSFLGCIGSVNAGLLSHLCINFPIVETVEGQPGNFILREDDLHSLKLLQEKCTNLTTLETLIHSRNSRRLINPGHDDSQFIREALSQIDAQLKAISSLNKIIVRSYDGTPNPWVMELMQGLGWVILPGR